jgi:Flp pilus assembly protein TadD
MSQGHTAFPLALYCGVVLLIAGSVAAQSTEWEALTSEARALYERGRYEQAAVTARKALALAERELGPHIPPWPRRSTTWR